MLSKMIDNPNPNNFYSEEEMAERQRYIAEIKVRLLVKLKDLQTKIETDEPFPHANQTLDTLSDIDDEVDIILNRWYY